MFSEREKRRSVSESTAFVVIDLLEVSISGPEW